jgi:flavin reductase (DIM6/NTAB) family NADH-FMN oxidoreductase RutF
MVRAPRPALARASMECRLLHALDMGSTHLLVGEVLLFHVDDALVRPGPPLTVDSPALDPLARLGGLWYAGLGPLYSLERPAAPPRER